MEGGYIDKDGFYTQQHPEALDLLQSTLVNSKIDLVIEIGTANGGVANKLDEALVVFTVDIQWPKQELHKNITFLRCDALSPTGGLTISSLIENPDLKVALLCDGGNKKEEFNTFAPFLKTGDIIAAHDYKETKEDQDVAWDWCEITYKNIKESCADFNIKKHKEYDKLRKYAWGLFEKSN